MIFGYFSYYKLIKTFWIITLLRACGLGQISFMRLERASHLISKISSANLYLELKACVLTPLEENDKRRNTNLRTVKI